ncbi:hypothetical protein [Streptomyces phage phiScoe56]|nr:hypothetical protein [Streptomyces phage phiScoe56]
MGAGLYPPPTNPNAPRGIRYYANLGSTAYVGDTETRAYLATFTAEPARMYRIALSLSAVDTDGAGDNATVRYAKNSGVIRARWALGTTADVTSNDLGWKLQTVFDDDSMSSSGFTGEWWLGGVTAGDVAIAITLKAYRAAATYGQIRVLTGGGNATNLTIHDVGPWPVP